MFKAFLTFIYYVIQLRFPYRNLIVGSRWVRNYFDRGYDNNLHPTNIFTIDYVGTDYVRFSNPYTAYDGGPVHRCSRTYEKENFVKDFRPYEGL